MDTLEYGISSPQLAMMNNGQVFVAGQYEPPMNPPAGASPAPEDKEMAGKVQPMISTSGLSILVGSALLGDIQTLHPMFTDGGAIVYGASGNTAWMPLGVTAQEFAMYGELASAPSAATGAAVLNLPNFFHGNQWDLQRLNGGAGNGHVNKLVIDASTIVIGIYAAAARIDYSTLMTWQNLYALLLSNFPPGTVYDPVYTSLPERNVQNTLKGYGLYNGGLVTSSQYR